MGLKERDLLTKQLKLPGLCLLLKYLQELAIVYHDVSEGMQD